MANMTEDRAKNFQWISLAYLILFMLAVFAPSLIGRDYFGIPEAQVEELLIFAFGFTGIVIFIIYERLMEKKEKENQEMSDVYEHVKKELVSSYQYIGSINRQLEVLKKMVNDTSVSIYDQAKMSKELLHSLVSAASVSYGGSPVLLRFMNLDKLRTEREFVHPNRGAHSSFTVHNRDLKTAHEQGSITKLSQNGHSLILVPSDRRNGDVKAFLVVREDLVGGSEYDASVLKVFVNQAELIFRALQREAGFLTDTPPLEQVEAVTQNPQGEIS